MYKGNTAKLTMKQNLIIGAEPDGRQFACEVLDYDEQECILSLALMTGTLTDLSLNAVYECDIEMEGYGVRCDGVLSERYSANSGQNVKVKIKNGFYKITIK